MIDGEVGNPAASLHIGGIEVQYYLVCSRKLWWFTHDIEQEHTSDLVALGRQIHEESYPRIRRKDILIDGEIRVDFTDEGAVHEVKKSRAKKKAHLWQLKYYLFYLKQKGISDVRGVLDYPKERRREVIELKPEDEQEIERILKGVEEIKRQPTPPEVEMMPICQTCSYQELCWG